jgi:YHS domain-containing protein
MTLALAATSMLIAMAAPAAVARPGDDAINKSCPVSGEPVDGRTFLSVGDHRVGFCCKMCVGQFARWDEPRKEAFVAKALGVAPQATPTAPAAPTTQPAAGDDEAPPGDPYSLATCPVSGKKLGSMGDAIVRSYDGREVRFCCAGCIGTFEASKEKYIETMDEMLIKQQMPFYPLDTCIITGESLLEDGKDIAVNYVYNNRLVRLCCNGCVRQLKKDPAPYLKNLDEAVIAAQRERYPSKVCPISGGPLGSMGEPAEIVVGNRLVRLCCAGCIPAIKADPVKHLATLDRDWKKAGYPSPHHAEGQGHEKHGEHGEHEGHGEHDGHDH